MANTLSRATQSAPIVHTALSLGKSPASSGRPHFCFMAHLLLLPPQGGLAPCSTCFGPPARLAAASPLRSAFVLGIRRGAGSARSFPAPTLRPGPFPLLHLLCFLSPDL